MKLGNWVIYYQNFDGTVHKTGLCSRRHAFLELYDGAIAIKKVRGLRLRAVVEPWYLPILKQFENDFPFPPRDYTWNRLSYFLFSCVVISILINLFLIYKILLS